MLIVIHTLGEWVDVFRDTYARERVGQKVTEYRTLRELHPVDRDQIEWMLEHGECATQVGNTVYQIRHQ